MFGSYPTSRLRRTRQSEWHRRLVAEVTFSCDDLVWPVFIIDKERGRLPIDMLPGIDRLSHYELLKTAEQAVRLGIPALALFPCLEVEQRDENASEALNENGLIPRAVRALKEHFPQLGIMCDAALDPYTSHAHDGLVDPQTGSILNDETVHVLCMQALIAAQAGCDIVAPSDMMDGRVKRIRQMLDMHAFTHVCICAYTAKYASVLYGPFRDALFAQGLLKTDKKSYHMSQSQRFEPMREAQFDVQEGADMLIIKPSLFAFDVLWRIKTEFGLPTFVYQVSGEYAIFMSAIEHGLLNKKAILEEYMLSAKRAGADAIITYFAPAIAQILRDCEK